MIEGAFELQDHLALSWWDALVVSGARAGFLLSEDPKDRKDFGGTVVGDPFRHEVFDGPGR